MRYSRLESVEEKRNFRNAVIFIILALALVILVFWLGIPLIGRVATFVSGLKNTNKVSVSIDKTPPAPPNFNTFPDFTNQQTASVSGTAEPGATVKLTFDSSEKTTVVDKNGNFTFQNLSLQSGSNAFYALAIDSAGNTSQKTQSYAMTLDTKPPTLNIDSPSDGTQFFGSTQEQVTIKGTTDNGVSIRINDRIVAVDDSGNFQYTTTLQNGDNKFAIKATDQAGNTTEKDMSLAFSQ